MATTYTFKVNQLEMAPSLDGLTDVVTRVRYDYTGVNENGLSGSFSGATPMPAPESDHFTPLSQLTEADVISWLEAVADKPHMQERIQKQIENQVAPKYVPVPNPWAPQPTGSIVETPATGSVTGSL
jgi:hypothetical protein